MVLPEDLCARLSDLAEKESRTVSNMAKVLIQEGIQQRLGNIKNSEINSLSQAEQLISTLESHQTRRLRGAPRKFRIHKP